jgi:hypothetical protein
MQARFARVTNHWLVDVLGGVAYGVGGCCTKQGMRSPGDTGSWIRSSADGSAFGLTAQPYKRVPGN